MRKSIFAVIVVMAFASFAAAETTTRLDELDLKGVQQGWGEPQKNRSVDKHPLTIAGKTYEHGVGTHAAGKIVITLDGSAGTFAADVGLDDETRNRGSVAFRVIGDGKQLFKSGVMKPGDPAKHVEVKLDGVKRLLLIVDDAGDGMNYDHADWANATFAVSGAAPTIRVSPPQPPYILTPKESTSPRINSATVFGVRPGSPVLYTIAATGDRPMKFSVDGLPDGLKLDGNTGRVTGSLKEAGEHHITLRAKNAIGEATRDLKIVCGPTIALTPPMGWNSWNCWAQAVNDEKVRAAADAMVAQGLINHGWTYVNIDDCWENKPGSKDPLLSGPLRDDQGFINTNKKFPDMKALADYVHDKGLRIGIYSSPGPTTCGGYTGSGDHEEQDAQRWAEWGFDYIKYDWCSYKQVGTDLDGKKKPYRVLRAALDKQPRDILFSMCQYGMGDVWNWGTEVGGNCWRTTGDITDNWGSMSTIGFGQAGHEKFASPGHWNDPDMLVVGKVGWGPSLHPTKLSADEQYTHISLWCLLSAPLLIGCDMAQMDDFTRSLLSNDEVLEVNQDPLGKQASRIAQTETTQVWAKDLADGARAIGLFNLDEDPQPVTAKLDGRSSVRDLWRQKDLGGFGGEYTATVPRHGVVLLKVRPTK